MNDGNILVTGVDGELDINDVNGEVDLKNIGGSVVAHALNGHVVVTFNRIDAQKPMAFSSLNGDIDVTFPADFKANVSMRTDNGEVYSDFDVKLLASAPQQTVEDNRGKGGKYRVKLIKMCAARSTAAARKFNSRISTAIFTSEKQEQQ